MKRAPALPMVSPLDSTLSAARRRLCPLVGRGLALLGCICVVAASLIAQRGPRQSEDGKKPGPKIEWNDKFRQLEEILPTPNAYRTASGAPGHKYWQQQVDYSIDVELDDDKQALRGREIISYTNHSPDTLRYLWLQLDGNIFHPQSDNNLTKTAPSFDERFTYGSLERLLAAEVFDGSFKIDEVSGPDGQAWKHTIVKTMMRVDLPKPLRSGESTQFKIVWHYAINPSRVVGGRTGAEFFDRDGNWVYCMAQWFPRLCAYTDVNGWQHKQFLGRGEFTLEFGDYVVRITAPDDHVVTATGVLQNPDEVLTETWKQRLEQAKTSKRPVFVVTPDEAKANEKSKPKGRKTWIYVAENVRDFAWASSRKFIWDAMGNDCGGKNVMCMSLYPLEAEPLWSKYSTHAVAHTIDVYSKFTFDYPYPVAISVNGVVRGGMEYPMICFNGPRPEKDGTYTKRAKYGLISVVIHEVGHNWFPMIVNSDERQWTWMDEGLNTFVQYLAEQEWERKYPSRSGEPRNITAYMASTNQVPIMTNSESILQFGPNAYAKPATALNVLRETVLGRELFDFAFKEYSTRWMFKRPQPADLFRTLEDASGIDLDWFWRGWFYSTDHTDLAITGLRAYKLDDANPATAEASAKKERAALPTTQGQLRNKSLPVRVDSFPELADFYNKYDELDATPADHRRYRALLAKLTSAQRKLLSAKQWFYVVDLENRGGLVMPVILRLWHDDGSQREIRIPAEIWRRNPKEVSKLIISEKRVTRILLDPRHETADVDTHDNHWPPKPRVSRFKLFERRQRANPMREAKRESQRGASGGAPGSRNSGGRNDR